MKIVMQSATIGVFEWTLPTQLAEAFEDIEVSMGKMEANSDEGSVTRRVMVDRATSMIRGYLALLSGALILGDKSVIDDLCIKLKDVSDRAVSKWRKDSPHDSDAQ